MYEKVVIFNTLLYSVWCSYFSRQILNERFTPPHLKTIFLILLTHIIIILGGHCLLPDSMTFILTHTASFLSIFLWHYGSVKKKVLTYFLYTGVVMLSEMFCMSIYSIIQMLIYHRFTTSIGAVSIQTLPDLLLTLMIILTAGSLMCKVFADLAGTLSEFSSLIPMVQIIFPFYWLLLMLSLIYCLNASSRLYIFIIISIPAIWIFSLGIKNIQIQEKNRILRKEQIALRKKQLEFFKDQELEYQKLRKWNHDIENHLLSMNYLMKSEKYNEIRQYLNNISK